VKTYETRIEISAPPALVWQVLTQDMPKDPQTFGILRLDGEIAIGSRIKLCSEVAPKRAFSLSVEALDVPKRMVWKGGMPFGLFTGTRTFELEQTDTGTCFNMHEVFTGLFAGMITRSMPDLTPSFMKFAQALKTKAETP